MILSSLIARVISGILLCPPDVIDQSLLMVAPIPCSYSEFKERQAVNEILDSCWNADDGFDESTILGDRSDNKPPKPSTYGEITRTGSRQLFFHMDMTIDSKRKSKNRMVFADLGSGAGKLVTQAALELKFLSRATGIELSPSRHRAALRAWNKVQKHDPSRHQSILTSSVEVEFIEGDLLQADISNVTHIFVSSLCFTNEMIGMLEVKLIKEAPKLECVASLKKFPNMGYPNSVHYLEMSWTKPFGLPVYFYKCNNENF